MSGRALVLGLALAATFAARGLPAAEPPHDALRPFSATYHLSRAGILFGEVVVTLSISPEGDYRYRARTLTRGPVTLFRDDEVTEESEGRLVDGAVRPDRYSYSHRRDDDTRDASLTFDHGAGVVRHAIGGTRWTLPVPAGTQDKFSQQLALMRSLLDGIERPGFPVADGGGLRTYRYEPVGRETLETPVGPVDAVALARRKDDQPSRMTLWLAPALRFLPVKIERREEDDRFTMSLQAVTWGD